MRISYLDLMLMNVMIISSLLKVSVLTIHKKHCSVISFQNEDEVPMLTGFNYIFFVLNHLLKYFCLKNILTNPSSVKDRHHKNGNLSGVHRQMYGVYKLFH